MPTEKELQISPVVAESVIHNTKVRFPSFPFTAPLPLHPKNKGLTKKKNIKNRPSPTFNP